MSELRITHRRLPHWRLDGAVYFITFRLQQGALSVPERALVTGRIKAGNGEYYRLIAATVMPDHVHLLLQPNRDISLARILKGIKRTAAYEINLMRGTQGTLWQHESWDRIVRDQGELDEKLSYMLHNSVKAGLVDDPWLYDGWCLGEGA